MELFGNLSPQGSPFSPLHRKLEIPDARDKSASRISQKRPRGHGKEVVVGSSPTEGFRLGFSWISRRFSARLWLWRVLFGLFRPFFVQVAAGSDMGEGVKSQRS